MKRVVILLTVVLVGCANEETVKEIEPIEVVEESAAEKEERELIEAAEKREATEVSEPLEVKPGNDTFGEDIKTGRYNITLQGLDEGVVYIKNQDGFVEVGEYFKAETEYVFDANLYDTLETDIAITLNPVE